MSRPFHPSGIASTATVRVCASAANASATTMSTGRTILPESEQLAAGVDLLGLQQRVADAVALRGEEREAHPAADEQRVDLRQQRLDDGELVGDLRPAEHHHVRPLRLRGQPAQHLDLGEHEPAGVGGQPPRHVVHRRLLAVHDAEPVGDERAVLAGERGELEGERLALGVVLRRLARVEPDVLQQHDVAGGQAHRARRRARSSGTGRPSSSPSRAATGASENRGSGRTLRPPEVGGHDDLGHRVGQRGDRRDRGADPAVVGDLPGVVERDVEVRADEHRPPGDPLGDELVERPHSFDATRATMSTRRLE